MTSRVVSAIARIGAPDASIPTSRNSTEPANTTVEITGASHQGNPWLVTTMPKPMPIAKRPDQITQFSWAATRRSDRSSPGLVTSGIASVVMQQR